MIRREVNAPTAKELVVVNQPMIRMQTAAEILLPSSCGQVEQRFYL